MKVARFIAALAVMVATTSVSGDPQVEEETKSLDELYQDAINEGGQLVVYHGGDTPTQQDDVAIAFRAAFPKIDLSMVVDYSKYHDVRVDNQLETNSLVADIVALQTVNDYPRWKRQGKLLEYKPAGFSKIYQGFVDPEGSWISHVVFSFSYFYDLAQLNASGLPVPKSAGDLANPVYANHIASTYPQDDDAALFIYTQYVERYGWEWVEKLARQNVHFQRGSNFAGEWVAEKKKAIGIAGDVPAADGIVFVSGERSTTPYLSWGQRMSILKKAPHPAAAKLFMNWAVSTKVQTTVYAGMSVRTDLPPAFGTRYPWDIPQANTLKFQKWMEDRAKLERLRDTFVLYFGEVQGEPSPGWLGLHPPISPLDSLVVV